MLKKLLFAVLLFANYSAYSQFTNKIASAALPPLDGQILDVVDYNNDGFEDVVYLNGDNGNIVLYRNLNGVFSDVTNFVGLPTIPTNGNGSESVISFDYNNDGFQDILVAMGGTNGSFQLFKNNCGSNFTDVTAITGLSGAFEITTQNLTKDPMVVISNFDNDNDLDILFATKSGTNYGIKALKFDAGSFAEQSLFLDRTSPIIFNILDADNDSKEDIVCIVNSSINNTCVIQLFYNIGGGAYSEINVAVHGLASNSPIGFVTVFDYNNDGWDDILMGTKEVVLPSSGNSGNVVYKNNAGAATTIFSSVSVYNTYQNANLGDNYFSHVFDYDNDGDNDVLWEINKNSAGNSIPALMRNNGLDVFNNVIVGLPGIACGTNAGKHFTIFDYDNNGTLDIFKFGAGAVPDAELYQNNFISNKYIELKLISCNGTADPIGTRVVVKTNGRRYAKKYLASGNSTGTYGKSERLHFGLGNQSVIDTIEVYWPNQASPDYYFNVNSNQILTLSNPNGACNIGQPLVFDLGPDTNNVCNTDTAYLMAPAGFVTYAWSNGDLTPDTKISTKGWYYCSVTNVEGCTAFDSVYVAFGTGRILQPDTTLCKGSTYKLDAYPRYDCSPFGAPVQRVVNAGDDLGPELIYIDSYNGHHYYKMRNASTWSRAEQDAINAGGHLVVINTVDENEFIKNNPSINNNNLWIGLYKPSTNEKFRWVNCDTFDYSNWATGLGSPSVVANENYVYMRNITCPNAGEWKNTDETIANPDLCENNIFGLVEFDNSTNVTYLWSDGQTTPSITITADPATPNYNVKITQNGASCFGNINLTVIDPNNLIPLDTISECHASFVMIQALEGMTSYLWSTGSKNSFIFVSTSGNNRWYKVTAVTPEGCTGVDSVYVSLYNANILTGDTSICLGSTAFLRGPVPPYSYVNDYNYDFDVVGPEWSSSITQPFPPPLGSKVLGPFRNDSIVLSLTNLPVHDSIRITFDLFIHDTWEGNDLVNGPDRWRMRNLASATPLINTTFSNKVIYEQNYPVNNSFAFTGATQTGLAQRCTDGPTTKYTITKSFRHSLTNLDLAFIGELIDGTPITCNESWTLDNVKIDVRRPGGLLWSTGDTTQNIYVTPLDPYTEYWVRVPVGNTYCWDTISVSTYTGKVPGELFYTDSIKVCGDYAFTYSLPANFDKYTWSNGETSRSTTLYNEGWYIGYVETVTGCYGSDSIYLSESKAKIFPDVDTSVCYGAPLNLKIDYNNDCSPFGGPVNIGFVPGMILPGYTYKGEYRGHHYYLADVHSTWSQAAQNALASGGHLAIINDTAEQNFIADVVDSNAWLGLYMGSNGYFVWMNCDTLTYTNWAASEPSPSPDDYVFMMATGCPEAKKWDSHTDDDMSSTDPCHSSIYGLLEIQTFQYQYDWRENGVSFSTLDSVTVNPTGDVSYSVLTRKDSSAVNCGGGTIRVSVITEGFDIIPDSVAKISCAGDTAMIEAKKGYSNYHWNNGDTTRIAVYSSYIGWAYCMYDNGTCKFVDSVYVNVPGKLTGNPSITNITCYGANDGIGNAAVTGGTPPFVVNWLHNGSSNTLEPNLAPGVYYYTVTDSNNCFTMDSVTITNPDSALGLNFVTFWPLKCNGDTNAAEVPVPFGGEFPYTGTWLGFPYGDTLWYAKAGIYTYTVTDARGCVFSKNDTITEPSPLIFSATITKQIYCPEDSNGVVFLAASGGGMPYQFGWDLAPITGDSVFKVYQGLHLAIVMDSFGCIDTAIVDMVASNPEKCGLIVPSGFTPNGDGLNDLFYIKGLGDYPDNELTIFNRWGETVYHTTNYKNDWNGKPMKETLMGGNSEIVPNDTYFYILHTTANNKTVSGYVYITK